MPDLDLDTDFAETTIIPDRFEWTRYVVERPDHTLSGFFIAPVDYPALAEVTGAQEVGELLDEAVVVILGAAGLGRTTILRDCARKCQARVISGEGAREVRQLVLRATPPPSPDEPRGVGSVFIDDVDRTVAGLMPTLRALVDQMKVEAHRPRRIWLSARADAWSDEATAALQPLGSADHAPKIVHLGALTSDDVRLAAEAYGLDAATFFARMDKGHGVVLARTPGTLLPLLDQVRREGRIPPGRGPLYETMCRAACKDDPTLLLVAARLAAFMVFSGLETVGSGATLTLDQLAGAPEEDFGHEAARALRPSDLGRVLHETDLLIEQRPGEWRWRIAASGTYLAAWYASQHRPDAPGIRGLFGHPSGRGSDQLQDCAAFAMDLLEGEARATLLELYPEAEPVSDLHLRPAADRLAAARRLLVRCDRGEGDTRDELYKLAAPDLHDLLRPYIEDASRDRIARRQAIHIVRETETRELLDSLVVVALDAFDDYGLRDDAAYVVFHLGTNEQVERLRPLLERSMEQDPRDQLLGVTLRALWRRGRLSVEDMFPYLRPPQNSRLSGSYSFLLHELEQTVADWLDERAFSAAVSWWIGACRGERSQTRDHSTRRIGWDWDRGRLWSAILAAATLRLDEPAFAGELARWFEANGARHKLDPLRAALDKRPEVAGPCLALLARAGVPPRELLFGTDEPLVTVSTVIDLVNETPRPAHFDWLLALLQQMHWSPDDESRLIALYLDDPETFACFAHLHHCDWPGPEADAQRQRYEEWLRLRAEHTTRREEREREEADREAVRAPVIVDDADHWLDVALEKVESGDDAWFTTLVHRLSLESGEAADVDRDTYEKLHEAPRWLDASDERRARILDAIEAYLTSGGDDETEWWTTNSIPWSEIAAASALNLLARARPKALEHLPDAAWHRWTPILLRGSGERPHERVLTAAHRRATASAAEWMLIRLRATDTTELGFRIDARRWAELWPDALKAAAEVALEDTSLTSEKRGTAARWLVTLSLEPGLEVVLNVLSGTQADEAWALIAGGALGARPIEVWPHIAERLRASTPAVGRRMLAFATEEASREAELAGKLTIMQAEQLLAWLDEHFPESENPMSFTGFSPWPFRDTLVGHLRSTPSLETAAVLRASGRRFSAQEVEALWRRSTWRPASVEALRCMFTGVEATRIHTPNDWRASVHSALVELAAHVHPRSFWHRAEAGRWSPCREARIADIIGRALREELAKRMVDGQVAILGSEAETPGLECQFEREGLRLSVVVEITPNWSLECDAPVEADGLRLVPWFGGFAWSRRTGPEDQQRRSAAATWSPKAIARVLGDDGVVLDLQTVETPADMEADLPFGQALRASLIREGCEIARLTSLDGPGSWLLRLRLPDALRARFGLAPEVILLAVSGPVDYRLLMRARQEIDGDDLTLDFDLMLVTSDDPQLVEQVDRARAPRQCVPWPLGGPPLLEWLPERLRVHDIFDTEHPVRGNRMLGRDDEVAELTRQILAGQSLAVLGLRKVGKTSLVRGIQDRLGAEGGLRQIGFFWLDLQTIVLRTEAALARALGETLNADGPIDDIDSAMRLLRRHLDGNQRVCLVLDEFDYLFVGYDEQPPIPGYSALLRALRGLAQTTERLSLVFIGRAPRHLEQAEIEGFPNPMLGWTKHHWVHPFDVATSAAVLDQLGRRVNLVVDPMHAADAHEWTGGHPALLRQFGSVALALVSAKGAITTRELDWEDLLDDLLDRPLLHTVAREITQLLAREAASAHGLLVALACTREDPTSIVEYHGGRHGDALRTLRRFGVASGSRSNPRLPRFLVQYLRAFIGPDRNDVVTIA